MFCEWRLAVLVTFKSAPLEDIGKILRRYWKILRACEIVNKDLHFQIFKSNLKSNLKWAALEDIWGLKHVRLWTETFTETFKSNVKSAPLEDIGRYWGFAKLWTETFTVTLEQLNPIFDNFPRIQYLDNVGIKIKKRSQIGWLLQVRKKR